jgi:hypothetical protein
LGRRNNVPLPTPAAVATNVRNYREGIEDWTAAGLPAESGLCAG